VSCGNLELDFPPNGPSLMAHMRGFARYEILIKRNARYEVHSEMRLVLAVDQGRCLTQPPSSSCFGVRFSRRRRHPYSSLDNIRLYITFSSNTCLLAFTLMLEETYTHTYAYRLTSRNYGHSSQTLRAPKNGTFYRKTHTSAYGFVLQGIANIQI
jgi:hypothetical protein